MRYQLPRQPTRQSRDFRHARRQPTKVTTAPIEDVRVRPPEDDFRRDFEQSLLAFGLNGHLTSVHNWGLTSETPLQTQVWGLTSDPVTNERDWGETP